MAQRDLFRSPPPAWNAKRIIGAKPPFKPKHVWAIRQQLGVNGRVRDRALLNCGIDAKLRGCDLVKLRLSDVAPGGVLRQRATVIQQKTGNDFVGGKSCHRLSCIDKCSVTAQGRAMVSVAVAVEGLTKRFDGKTILHPTDLAVAAGELVVIVGPSGCGKSTLLRLVAGLEEPSGGRVTIGGRDVTQVEASARGVAMVFQSYALYPHLTVAENIAFPLRMARRPRDEIAERVQQVAQFLELEPFLTRRPRALSGGQRQRVSIARAVVRDPPVLLLDEPLSNLDAGLRVRMRHELARLHQRLGCTMIYVTHDQVEAMTLANRIIVMSEGRVEQVGAPLDLYEAPATLHVARTIGSPAMNFIPVTISGADGSGARVVMPNGGACEVAAMVQACDIGASATLGIRPEHLRPAAHGPFTGRVELFERLGPLAFAHMGETGGLAGFVAQLPSDRQITLGETIAFSAEPRRAHLFSAGGDAYPRLTP